MCFWRKKLKISSIQQIIEICDRDPERILSWILRNIRYISDKKNHSRKDYNKTPEETLTGKYLDGTRGTPMSGDCEDFCILAHECLKELDVSTNILTVFKLTGYAGSIPRYGDGHAVLAVFIGDHWYHFSNWGLKRCKGVLTISEIPPLVYPRGYWRPAIWKDNKLRLGPGTAFNI